MPMDPQPLPTQVHKDRWLLATSLVVLALCIALAFLRPTGDGWGRGWNMIAFLLYASPAAVLSGVLALWRINKVDGRARVVAMLVSAVGLFFPLICIAVLRAKG